MRQGMDGRSGRESAQIIYMGDVRRKRGRTRQAPDRQYLGAIALVAASAWSVWITVLFSLAPARLLTYLAFFAPLYVALAASGALAAYWLDWKQGTIPSLRTSVRRGALFALLAVANLAFLAGHRWSPVVGFVTILAVLAIEASTLRKRP
jgi:hypothetical protein